MDEKQHKSNAHGHPYFAFFDVDETLISVKSMFSFLRFFLTRKCGIAPGNLKFYFHYYRFKLLARLGKSRELINLEYYKLYARQDRTEILSYGSDWFSHNLRHNVNFFNKAVIKELKAHQRVGAKIVLISGSFEACLLPIADHLKADIVLGANLEFSNNQYTGNIISPQTIGAGKAQAMKYFLNKMDYKDYQRCFAYADHISDLPMLELVGHPVVVVKCPKLKELAQIRGWSTISTDL